MVGTALVLAATLAATAAAQTPPPPTGPAVHGRILDEDGAPLGGASILLVEPHLEAVSQADGQFTVNGVAAGTFTIQVKLLGYRQQSRQITVGAAGLAGVDFALEADPLKLEGVVVTGTQAPRVKLESSMAVTTLSPKDIDQASPRSTTEMLRYVPGFTRVESSGGEVNENITMRGILGVEYVMFMEDGLPVFPTMHTFFMNADNLFRADENIERVEVVRGGSSALFGSNTPGAIVNFINKTGGATQEGVVKITGGSGGLARTDLSVDGPLGDHWRFAVGGFYRYDQGIRDPGYPGIRGGQFKGSITRLLDTGYLRVTTKVIDDRNQFILPLPFVDPAHPKYVEGFSDYGAMNTNEGLDIRVPVPTGELELPLDDGLATQASWVTADLGLDMGDGWRFQNIAQQMQDQQQWNAIVPIDAVPADSFVAQQIRGLVNAGVLSPGATGQLFYTNHFDAFGNHERFDTANGLVSPSGEWHVEKPLSAFQDQLQIKKTVDRGTFALGAYFANYTQTNRWYFTDILMDVRDNPRFVDLVVYDGPDTIDVTKNGFRNFLSNYVNGSGQATVVSGMLGAEFKVVDRLRADIGGRWEYNDFVQSSENTTLRDLDGDPKTVYDREPWGNGSFRHFSRDIDDWAASVGLNYKFNDQLAAYALGSRAYKMPALDEFLQATAQQAVDLFEPRHTYWGEGGVKFMTPRIGLAATGFYGKLKNIVGQGAVQDPTTGRITWVILTSPENSSYGAELELSGRVARGVEVLANATLLKAEQASGTDIGAWLNGVPPVIGNVSATWTLRDATLLGDVHYVARRYSDQANGTQLPAYAYANFGASWRFQGRNLLLSADLLNAFQSTGLEEGNPRLTGMHTVFFARPILPRRVTLAIRHDF